MAYRSCASCLELLPRSAARPIRSARSCNAGPSIARTFAAPAPATQQTRRFHQTPRHHEGQLLGSIKEKIGSILRKSAQPYQIFGATEQIYATCAAQAAYKISPEARKNDTLETTEDGEEIGVGGGMWHDDFKLIPTFSTWSQVTMLHMYLIVVRARCLEKDSFHAWQSQLVDHFFHDAEERMDLTHNIASRGVRQRYLRDLFVTWRGLMLAYDEGLAKGDAVLASAVWRNLFKGAGDVDVRTLAAIVSWMRMCLKNLDQMQDPALLHHGGSVFKWPAKAELVLVDRPVKELGGLLNEEGR